MGGGPAGQRGGLLVRACLLQAVQQQGHAARVGIVVEAPGPAPSGVGQVAGQGEMGDGVAALLAGPWELAARQGVLQVGEDLAEGKQFRPVGNALGQQA